MAMIEGVMRQPTPISDMARQSPFQMAERPKREAIQAIVSDLEAEANRRVGLRLPLEQDWIADLLQYHGYYDATTMATLKAQERSQVYMNLTRPKTRTLAARIKDILFPTDDRNWGIDPTPVPRLQESAEQAAAQAMQLEQQAATAEQAAANDNADPAQKEELQAQADATKQKLSQARAYEAQLNQRVQEGKDRARMMAEVIDDQLTECNYQAVKRAQIDIACKLGTGVTKGPVTGERVRRGWKQRPQTDQYGRDVLDQVTGSPAVGGEHYLEMSEGEQPGFRIVDIWNFFPDMDVANVEDGQGVFERHLMNKMQLKKLQHLKGFDKDAIRRLLLRGPDLDAPSYLADLRNIRGATTQVMGPLYQVWEYSGPLDSSQIYELALHTENEKAYNAMVAESVDPLMEVNVVVWFCKGEILKFSLYPYDSGECYYSVYCLYKDESSVFGYGMPRVIRDPQAALNAGARTMLDNAGITAGPQVIIDTSSVTPADGDYTLRPRKLWLASKGWSKENPPVQSIGLDNHQAELANIMAIFEQFLDKTSGVPMLASGEQGSDVTKTAQGMALLMNSTNVVLREPVKNFDIDVTEPDIRRLYDWNMQFHPNEAIKGDYDVKARGSSVLLVRELQAQQLMTIALQFGGHPVYGPMLKNRDLLKKLFQAHMIDYRDVMLTDVEIDAVLAQAAAAAAEEAKMADKGRIAIEVETMRLKHQQVELEAKIELANMDRDTKLQLAAYQRDTLMMETAARMNMSLEAVQAQLEKSRADIEQKDRALAVEAAITQAQPPEQPTGGGYL